MTSSLAELAVFMSGAAGWSILAKATLFLLLGLAAAWLARRQRASVRHVVLAATFAALAALPMLALLGPAVSVEIPVAASPQAPVRDAIQRRTGRPARSLMRAPSPQTTSPRPSWTTIALASVDGRRCGAHDRGRPRTVARPAHRPQRPPVDRASTARPCAGPGRWSAPGCRRPAARRCRSAVRLGRVAADDCPARRGGGLERCRSRRALIHELEHVRRWTGRCSSPHGSRAGSTGSIRWSGWRGGGSASRPNGRATMPWYSGRKARTTPSSSCRWRSGCRRQMHSRSSAWRIAAICRAASPRSSMPRSGAAARARSPPRAPSRWLCSRELRWRRCEPWLSRYGRPSTAKVQPPGRRAWRRNQ